MVREGSAPNFCPPTEEGITITLVDEKGEQVELEFLGLVLKGESSFGFFSSMRIGAKTPARWWCWK